MLVGFDDGVVRVLVFQKKEVVDVHGRKKEVRSREYGYMMVACFIQ